MAKISNTLSYPNQSPIEAEDYLIGTAANSTPIERQTKTFTLGGIAEFVIDEAFDGCSYRLPIFTASSAGQESFKLVNSLFYQDTATITSKDPCESPAGTIVYLDNGSGVGSLSVAENVTIGKETFANGLVNVNGGIYFASEVYDANNNIGTGEQVLVSQTDGTVEWQNYQGSGLEFQGAWDADINVPDLTAVPLIPANTGKYWIVSVAGGTNLPTQGGGSIFDWEVGDWAIISEDLNNNIFWDKIDNSSVLTGGGTKDRFAIWTSPSELGDGDILRGDGDYSLVFNDMLTSDASGNYANAFGFTTQAEGDSSAAFGNTTRAGGTNSFVGGDGSNADGNNAFSFGGQTQASGDFSVAMGASSNTTGDFSVVLGQGNSVAANHGVAIGYANSVAPTGLFSFAMGFESTATGNTSIAIGNNAVASGESSLAIGGENIVASGNHSFASGENTTASGNNSLAIGVSAQSTGNTSIAMGNGSEASGNYSVSIGQNTEASGTISLAMGNGSEASNTVSVAIGNRVEASGAGAVALGQDTEASGDTSTAMGSATQASGIASTAMGLNTTASGDYSFASGSNTIASGQNSTAMGDASIASGDTSTALGNSAEASGIYSVAIGQNVFATSTASLAMGSDSEATNTVAVAIGKNATASGISALALGVDTISSGQVSTAMGSATTASGNGSTAMGGGSTASGSNSTAMGALTTASGNGSTAMGSDATASGGNSTAMGEDTTASGYASTAMGGNSTASGDFSVAAGKSNQASGAASIAIGDANVASGFFAQAYGKDAEASGDNSFAFGTLSTTTASGAGSFSFGEGNESKATGSFTMGALNVVDANSSFAIGKGNTINASAAQAFSFGKGNQNAGDESFTMGTFLNATDFRQIVIGSNNVPLPGSVNTWSAIDNLVTIGNGPDSANQSNALEIKKGGQYKLPTYGSGNVVGNDVYNLSVDSAGNVIETQRVENKYIINGMVNNLGSQINGHDFMEWTSNVTGPTQIPLWRVPLNLKLEAVTWVWMGETTVSVPVGTDIKFSIGKITNNTSADFSNYTPISDIFAIDNSDDGTYVSGQVDLSSSSITVGQFENIAVVGEETGALTPNSGELAISFVFKEIQSTPTPPAPGPEICGIIFSDENSTEVATSGADIPIATNYTEFTSYHSNNQPCAVYYNYDPTNGYGLLYNYWAMQAVTPPAGFDRVASFADWTTLTTTPCNPNSPNQNTYLENPGNWGNITNPSFWGDSGLNINAFSWAQYAPQLSDLVFQATGSVTQIWAQEAQATHMTVLEASSGYAEVGFQQGGPVDARLSYIRFAKDV